MTLYSGLGHIFILKGVRYNCDTSQIYLFITSTLINMSSVKTIGSPSQYFAISSQRYPFGENSPPLTNLWIYPKLIYRVIIELNQ